MNNKHTNSTGGGCCGFDMSDLAGHGCPCGSMLKRHRVLVLAVIALVLVAFLILHVGGLLGIAAFIRTF